MHTINIKVDDETYNYLYKLATLDDRSVAKYVLHVIKSHAAPPYTANPAESKVSQPATEPVWKNKYAGLTGDALMDAMDADLQKDYEVPE